MRFLQDSVRLFLALWLATAPVYAGSMTLLGAGKPAAGASYTGPGDVATFVTWGSCTYAYSQAVALAGSAACDVTDTATGTINDTVSVTSSGLVDYTLAKTGGHACATACRVKKIYDQAGGSSGYVLATLANMPDITFNAIGTLPAITCVNARSTHLNAATNTAISQPLTVAGVANRTGTTGVGTDIFTNSTGAGGADFETGYTGSINTFGIYAGANLNQGSVADSTAHAFSAGFNSTSSTINIDAVTQTTGNAGLATIGANGSAICAWNAGGLNMDGYIGEIGVYSGTYNSSVHSNIRTRWGL